MYYLNVILGINTFINPLYIYAQIQFIFTKKRTKYQYALFLKKVIKVITYKSPGLNNIPIK